MASNTINEKNEQSLPVYSDYSTININSGRPIRMSLPNSSNSMGNFNGNIMEGVSSVSSFDFQTIKAASDTLKRNPKMEFSKTDLIKLMSYLEGELQARDVVIAVLKSKQVKQFLQTSRFKPTTLDDPHAALFRDRLATSGNIASASASSAAAQSEQDLKLLTDQHLETLENIILQQRQTQCKIINVLHDTQEKQTVLRNELDDEKRKHERDTAQGDDIAYGLEIERTKLKQELENERNLRKKTEKDVKKVQDSYDQFQSRLKQIVLLLLAERKKVIVGLVEERKRSEDLAQILSEEKQRVDTIAEGLEEESKKSLQMESELEKQLQSFEAERKVLHGTIAKDEQRIKEQEIELLQLKAENESLRKQALPSRLGQPVNVPQVPNKSMGRSDTLDDTTPAMMSSVAKVVQPTATVSSVPVSGPTTGIARSISPGQSLRQTSTEVISPFNATKVTARKLPNTTNQPLPPSSATTIPQSTSQQQNAKNAIPITQSTLKKSIIPQLGRGVPPPIPPNKPVIPPKRENSRLGLNTSSVKEKETTTVAATPTVSSVAAMTNSGNSEVLADEIQDFQSVLCSMSK